MKEIFLKCQAFVDFRKLKNGRARLHVMTKPMFDPVTTQIIATVYLKENVPNLQTIFTYVDATCMFQQTNLNYYLSYKENLILKWLTF